MFCTCFVKTQTFILLRWFNFLFITVDMNCKLIYFVHGVIQYASLHWYSSSLCTNSLYYLLNNSQNISSSLLPISYFCCCKLITSDGELLTNSGISINHCRIWTLVCTKTPCSIYSGSDWLINLNPSNQYIFRNFITCSAHPWLYHAVDFQEFIQIPSEILTAPLLLNCKLPVSVKCIQYMEDKNVETYCSSDKQLFLHSLQNKMNLVRWFV